MVEFLFESLECSTHRGRNSLVGGSWLMFLVPYFWLRAFIDPLPVFWMICLEALSCHVCLSEIDGLFGAVMDHHQCSGTHVQVLWTGKLVCQRFRWFVWSSCVPLPIFWMICSEALGWHICFLQFSMVCLELLWPTASVLGHMFRLLDCEACLSQILMVCLELLWPSTNLLDEMFRSLGLSLFVCQRFQWCAGSWCGPLPVFWATCPGALSWHICSSEISMACLELQCFLGVLCSALQCCLVFWSDLCV